MLAWQAVSHLFGQSELDQHHRAAIGRDSCRPTSIDSDHSVGVDGQLGGSGVGVGVAGAVVGAVVGVAVGVVVVVSAAAVGGGRAEGCDESDDLGVKLNFVH